MKINKKNTLKLFAILGISTITTSILAVGANNKLDVLANTPERTITFLLQKEFYNEEEHYFTSYTSSGTEMRLNILKPKGFNAFGFEIGGLPSIILDYPFQNLKCVKARVKKGVLQAVLFGFYGSFDIEHPDYTSNIEHVDETEGPCPLNSNPNVNNYLILMGDTGTSLTKIEIIYECDPNLIDD